MTSPFLVEWREDSTATILARITSRAGSGAATGVNGEGNFLQIADVSSIALNVYDLDADDPTTAENTETVVVASTVLDTVVTSNVIWTLDTVGYNFVHDLSATYFSTGNRRYQAEYVFTLTDGSVFHSVYDGLANPVRSS